MSNPLPDAVAAADPLEAVRAELQTELAAGENVLAVLPVDLDPQLRFGQGVLALTDRRLLARAPGAAGWTGWALAPGLQLRHADHAGVGQPGAVRRPCAAGALALHAWAPTPRR